MQVERDAEGARAVGRRQGIGLPAAGSQTQRGGCSCGSGGASAAASLPSTWVCAWSVSRVARHSSYGSADPAGGSWLSLERDGPPRSTHVVPRTVTSTSSTFRQAPAANDGPRRAEIDHRSRQRGRGLHSARTRPRPSSSRLPNTRRGGPRSRYRRGRPSRRPEALGLIRAGSVAEADERARCGIDDVGRSLHAHPRAERWHGYRRGASTARSRRLPGCGRAAAHLCPAGPTASVRSRRSRARSSASATSRRGSRPSASGRRDGRPRR